MPNKPRNFNNEMVNGFTLIELLVVIAIIGLLASIVLVSLQGTRERAKIAKAENMVSQLHKVILINYEQSGGTSPAPVDTSIGTGCAHWGSGVVVGFVNNTGNYYENWVGPFFAEVPKDPWGNCYCIDGPVHESCPGNPNGSTICSAGPNGIFEGWNQPVENRGDDICKPFGCSN